MGDTRWTVLTGNCQGSIQHTRYSIDNKSLADTVALIEATERAAGALAGEASIAASSTYKAEARKALRPSPSDGTIKCEGCGQVPPRYGKNRHGRTVEFKFCVACFRSSKSGRAANSPSQTHNKAAAVSESENSAFEVLGVAHAQKRVSIDNHIFDGTLSWRAGESSEQPTLPLLASVDTAAYRVQCTYYQAYPHIMYN